MRKRDRERLAAALKQARERMNQTQTEFAAHLGVNQATISRWEERGPTNGPARLAVQKIIDAVENVYGPAR